MNLGWTPVVSAISHDVYIGENFDDVNDGAEGTFYGNQTLTYYIAGISGSAYTGGLVPDTTYYWRIDEITAAGTIYKGDVWSFTTTNFLIVDDFELYNDFDPDDPESNRIFMTWKRWDWLWLSGVSALLCRQWKRLGTYTDWFGIGPMARSESRDIVFVDNKICLSVDNV